MMDCCDAQCKTINASKMFPNDVNGPGYTAIKE